MNAMGKGARVTGLGKVKADGGQGLGDHGRRLWPLFLAVLLFISAGTAQNVWVSYRSALLGADTGDVGLLMALYFGGLVAGALRAPKVIARMGHFRAFVLAAAFGATSVALFILPPGGPGWMLAQVLTGFAIAGQYVVVESWLNLVADTSFRARLFGLYMFFWFAGAGLGPLLINLGPYVPGGVFALVALLTAGSGLAVAPLMPLSREKAPVAPMPLRALYRASPAGAVTTYIVGLSFGAAMGMTAAFGQARGLSAFEVSVFVAAFLVGGALTQYPIGHWADRTDRRVVAAVSAFLAALSTLPFFTDAGFAVLTFSALAFGGFSLPLYTLGVAQAQDHMAEAERVAAAGGLLLLNSKGAFVGPLLIGLTTRMVQVNTLFYILCAAHVLLGLYCLHRKRVQPK